MIRLFAITLLVLPMVATTANASCRMATAGAKCAAAPTLRPPLPAGTPLPEDAKLLLNPDYYGLPPVDGAWRYYVVNNELYRVDSRSLEVIERIRDGNRYLW